MSMDGNIQESNYSSLKFENMTKLSGTITAKDKIKIIVLYQLANKNWKRGTILNKEKFNEYIKYDRTAYKLAHEFLEGAGLVVNDVVFEEKVPEVFLSRYEVVLNG